MRIAVVVVLVAISLVEPGPEPWPDPVQRLRGEVPSPSVPCPREGLALMDSELLAGLALGEDPRAPVAVMWVALNRARGRTVIEAVTEGRAFGSVVGGEFRRSWSLAPRRRWQGAQERAALERFEGLARAVLAGLVADPTRGATHFHRVGTWTPPWAPSEEQWRVLGDHAFYKVR